MKVLHGCRQPVSYTHLDVYKRQDDDFDYEYEDENWDEEEEKK